MTPAEILNGLPPKVRAKLRKGDRDAADALLDRLMAMRERGEISQNEARRIFREETSWRT